MKFNGGSVTTCIIEIFKSCERLIINLSVVVKFKHLWTPKLIISPTQEVFKFTISNLGVLVLDGDDEDDDNDEEDQKESNNNDDSDNDDDDENVDDSNDDDKDKDNDKDDDDEDDSGSGDDSDDVERSVKKKEKVEDDIESDENALGQKSKIFVVNDSPADNSLQREIYPFEETELSPIGYKRNKILIPSNANNKKVFEMRDQKYRGR